MDMKIIHESETIANFVNDSKFMGIKKREISNLQSAMEKKIRNSF